MSPPFKPAIGVLHTLECERLEGESMFETMQRLLTHEIYIFESGNQVAASERLGISRTTLLKWQRKYGIRPELYRPEVK